MADEEPRRCLHCGKDRTYRGMPLTGRFCSPDCLRASQSSDKPQDDDFFQVRTPLRRFTED